MKLVSSVLLSLAVAVLAYDNGPLGATPPMGWSTWCTRDICGLRDQCNAWEIKKRAHGLVDQGLAALGYKWLFLDDCWAETTRDAEGRLQGDLDHFPDGMKELTDYVHGLGLYLSVYT